MSFSEEIEEENALERALRLACEEPAHMPAFYKTLMESKLVLLATEELALDDDCEFPFISWVDPEDPNAVTLACLTSHSVLQASIDFFAETGLVEPGTPFMVQEVEAAELFQLALAAEVAFQLNPFCGYSTVILPHDARRLLLGESELEQEFIHDGQIELFVPWPMPDELIFSLSQLFAQHSCVERAYVLFMKNRVKFTNYYVVVIETDSAEVGAVFDEAARVSNRFDFETTPEPVMFIPFNRSQYMSHFCVTQLTPFYERSWGQNVMLVEAGEA